MKSININSTCEHCCTRIDALSVKVGHQVILDTVNLHVNCREILAIVGPNGAGKSTLLKAMLGIVRFEGHIHWQLRGEKHENIRIGYVPQTLTFDRNSPISVADFLGCAMNKRPVWLGISNKDKLRIEEALAAVSATTLMYKRIGDLSGGELQRILLCLALSSSPDMLLLDEAAAGVDLAGLELFYTIVKKIRDSHDVAVILVTHDLFGIAQHANRMLLLNRKVLADGTPSEILSSPQIIEVFGREIMQHAAIMSEGKHA